MGEGLAEEVHEAIESFCGFAGVLFVVGSDDGRLDGWLWPEDLGRKGRDAFQQARALHQDADRAEVAGAGTGGEAFGHLPLHGKAEAVDGQRLEEQVDQQRGGDAVGQVGDEHEAAGYGVPQLVQGLGQLGGEAVFGGEGVGVDEADVVGLGEAFDEDAVEHRVEFDGDDPARKVRQVFGEASGAGADFEDAVVARGGGGGEQAVHQVAVDEEVLTEAAFGFEAGTGQQLPDIGLGLELSRLHVASFRRGASGAAWGYNRDSCL